MRRLWFMALLIPIGCAREEAKVVSTPGGVRYQDLVEGIGAAAGKGNLIEVNYIGTLTDGTEFDKNQDKSKPASFTLGAGRVILGWEEGLPGMKVGGKRKLWIPASLGYGRVGNPPKIPPNAALVFEVELLAVKPAPEAAMVATPSGLRYQDVVEGSGDVARTGDTVEVHYTSTLSNGAAIESNLPEKFQLGAGKVIKGWDEGLPGMRVGGKRKLIVPPELAYGATGDRKIPPHATLIFEVELVNVKAAPPPGGVTTESGLRYFDLVEGSGDEAQPGKTVEVHYTGTLANGTKFDSSLDRGMPFSFPLGARRVIRGWDEGVAGMKVGGKRRLIIPPELGYGVKGSPPKIPPNSTLIFEIELLGVTGRK